MYILPLLALCLTGASPLKLPQASVEGVVPVVQLPIFAQMSMLTDPSSHSYDVEGLESPLKARTVALSTLDEFAVLWNVEKPSLSQLASYSFSQNVTYSTGYPVTSVQFLPDGRLLVAGASRAHGRAIIELWTFKEPSATSNEKVYCGLVAKRSLVFSAPAGSDYGHLTWMLSLIHI